MRRVGPVYISLDAGLQGQRIADPAVDIAALARAQGALGLGPIERADGLVAAFREAVAHVDGGGVAVVDVITEPGYTPAMVTSPTPTPEPTK